MFSNVMDLLHVPLTVLNWLVCLSNLWAGHFTAAVVSAVIAAVLTWQLTW
jgi:hypothetical protein